VLMWWSSGFLSVWRLNLRTHRSYEPQRSRSVR
jgi:hypothetical protein